MPILAKWYDFRDLGNAIGALQDQILDWGAPDWVPYVVSGIIGVVGILLWLLVSQIIFIWIERRVIGLMHNRIGPNRVGPMGLLQGVADAIKLLLKEAITPRATDTILFWAAPIAIFIPAMVVFAVIPFGEGMVLSDLDVGVLFFVAIGSINTIAVFAAGWSSNNKFALIGAMRQIAMLISYELVQVFAILGVVIMVGSMRMVDFVEWQSGNDVWMFAIQPLALVAFIIAGLVEVNRSPADISEAESELIAGFHTEYSGIKFGFFYAAEYFATFALCGVIVTLFMGGWTLWGLEEWVPGFLIFLTKLYAVFFIFIWARGTLPRLRIDQLMAFSWKFLLELMFVNILVVGLETLIWREGGYDAATVLPIFAAINWVLAIGLAIFWARMLGHGTASSAGKRATLTQELGAIYYEGAGTPGA
ncbi:MAG: NADH-quinone oxidoreductase subunit NuoH [Chloroflexi bacterium]|nr:NADH-quinone oxidoreductase subunit NuoH [Chloroflexota bacterium]